MVSFREIKSLFLLFTILMYPTLSQAICSESPDRFNEWISDTREQALKNGVHKEIADEVFSNLQYREATINADRKMFSSPPLSFKEYLETIPYSTIIATGKQLKKKNEEAFRHLKRKYGVPAGVIISLWGLESSFGTRMGKVPILSTLATLAYDCRRSKFFTEEFFAALYLVDKNIISPTSLGAMYGEIGQFQFLPSNVKKFAVDADEDGQANLIESPTDAIVSAANFLSKNGWVRCKGYQPTEANFATLKRWNSSTNYIKTVAYIAAHIDGIKLNRKYD
ncbi:lytic murein transglycosylase [Candidatus Liberibacter africanus]|uniref:lytic murein transglycosylase n=1 Tax=Liberibacter africanus TaxID=34020 RepID=UPI001FD5CF23|nr:lytic murein transglycosylase [Candidatus Liberibacter africanus]